MLFVKVMYLLINFYGMKNIVLFLITLFFVACSDMERDYVGEAKFMTRKLNDKELCLIQRQYLESMSNLIKCDIALEMAPRCGMNPPVWAYKRDSWLQFSRQEKNVMFSNPDFHQEQHLEIMRKYIGSYGKSGMAAFLKEYRLKNGKDLSKKKKELCDSVITTVIAKYPL